MAVTGRFRTFACGASFIVGSLGMLLAAAGRFRAGDSGRGLVGTLGGVTVLLLGAAIVREQILLVRSLLQPVGAPHLPLAARPTRHLPSPGIPASPQPTPPPPGVSRLLSRSRRRRSHRPSPFATSRVGERRRARNRAVRRSPGVSTMAADRERPMTGMVHARGQEWWERTALADPRVSEEPAGSPGRGAATGVMSTPR